MQSQAQDIALWLRNPVFAAAGESACCELARACPATIHPPGTQVVEAGAPADALRVLLQGTVRVFHRMPDGREVVVKLLRAPALLGDAEVLQGIPAMEHVEAVDEIALAAVPAARYLELLRLHPAAAVEHLRQQAGARCVSSRNERLLFASLEQRMANLLLSYADYFGEPGDGQEVVIGCRLPHPLIARSLGTVRRVVVKMMSRWTRLGLVASRGSQLVLLQPAELEQLAASIRGSLCFEMGMPLDHLSRQERTQQGEVELLDGPGSLPGRRFEVGDELQIGRAATVGLRLPDEQVCPHHCRIFRAATGGRFWVEDLDSVNGTYLNGRRVRRAVLHEGDRIRVGALHLRFQGRIASEDVERAA